MTPSIVLPDGDPHMAALLSRPDFAARLDRLGGARLHADLPAARDCGIGARLAGLLEAIGMRVVAWTLHRVPARLTSPRQRFVELPELLATADLVSLHLLLTDETRGMIDESLLRSLKPGALLVNTARAELIAPGALERVLAEGRIAAALDVFDTEPLAAGSALRDLPNVVLSPHQGYNTPESLERMLDVVVANIEHYRSGAPANIVSAAWQLFAIGNYVPFS